MGFLAGKRILITGPLSNHSIAYGIASTCKREGAELAFTYVGERFKNRITEFITEFDNKLVFNCGVSSGEWIAKVLEDLGQHWGHLDGLVHSIGFALRGAIADNFIGGLSRESFRIAYDISAYSSPALAKATLPMLSPTTSLLALTYLGAECIVPNYSAIGLAKASPEAGVRYLAGTLGPKGIRADGISADLIKTLAVSGIKDFDKLLKYVEDIAPLRRNVMIKKVGNVAAFLLSDLASGVTGKITCVDYGFNMTVGMPESVGQG